jgi:HEPN domain-containing protein
MPPRRLPSDDPREWLNRARSDLTMAKAQGPEIYYEDLCFHAQQAAEKAIKAVLLRHGIRFPYVHDIRELIRLLKRKAVNVPARVLKARELTNYAVETRYPGLSEPVSDKEYHDAVVLAEAVVRWADKQIMEPKRRKGEL